MEFDLIPDLEPRTEDENYARWATEAEIISSLSPVAHDAVSAETAGVPLYCRGNVAFTDPSDSHSMIIGASGSKKTRLFILPSILSLMKAGESMVVTDPKAELYERTSGVLRKNGYEVYCVNFRDDSCMNCWNPLDAPRQFFQNGKFDLAVGLLNDFSAIAVTGDDRRGDPFWDDMSRSAFMGMLLLMFLLAEDPREINIRGLLRMRNMLFRSEGSDYKNCLFHKLFRMLDPGSLAASYLSGLASAPERTLGSILATLDTHLIKFVMRPDLTDMLCRDDIDFHRLGHEKTAIFLVMPDEKETYHGLISIFVQQCYETLIFEAQKLEQKTLPRRVNFLLDEFSSLPPIKEFPAMIAAARSRNIRFNIVIQSEKQLRSRYGEEADTIKGNCNNWIFLYSRELPTLEELCRLCGQKEDGRPLITPSRLQRLDKERGEVLVIHGRNYPFLSNLDDISRYDHDIRLPEYCAVGDREPLRIFRIDALMGERSEGWITARLAQDTVAQAEEEIKLREQEAQRRAQEEQQALERQRKLLLQLPVQQALPTDNPIVKAAHRLACPVDGDPNGCLCRLITDAPCMVPPEPFPLNYLSVAVELSDENMGLVSESAELLDAAAGLLYRRLLAAGQSIPLFYDMRQLPIKWNTITQAKNKPNLLPLMLAMAMLGGEMPEPPVLPEGSRPRAVPMPAIEEPLNGNVQLLMEEFSGQPQGMPAYTVILHRLDGAAIKSDAVWQTCFLGSLPNVRVLATSLDPQLLIKNTAAFLNTRSGPPIGSPNRLYFDSDTNEVLVEQGPQPKHLLQLYRAASPLGENGSEAVE